jgi:hypothetical protein
MAAPGGGAPPRQECFCNRCTCVPTPRAAPLGCSMSTWHGKRCAPAAVDGFCAPPTLMGWRQPTHGGAGHGPQLRPVLTPSANGHCRGRYPAALTRQTSCTAPSATCWGSRRPSSSQRMKAHPGIRTCTGNATGPCWGQSATGRRTDMIWRTLHHLRLPADPVLRPPAHGGACSGCDRALPHCQLPQATAR